MSVRVEFVHDDVYMLLVSGFSFFFFFFQAEDGIRDLTVTGVQTCALPISERVKIASARSVPPRLARVSDRSADVAVYRLAGPGALAVAGAAGLEVPPVAGDRKSVV